MSEGRTPVGRPRQRWKNNNKINFREIGLGDTD
jgi:hypothetical protein